MSNMKCNDCLNKVSKLGFLISVIMLRWRLLVLLLLLLVFLIIELLIWLAASTLASERERESWSGSHQLYWNNFISKQVPVGTSDISQGIRATGSLLYRETGHWDVVSSWNITAIKGWRNQLVLISKCATLHSKSFTVSAGFCLIKCKCVDWINVSWLRKWMDSYWTFFFTSGTKESSRVSVQLVLRQSLLLLLPFLLFSLLHHSIFFSSSFSSSSSSALSLWKIWRLSIL